MAPDSQPSSESGPETEEHPNDERWRQKPISVGLSVILGLPQGMDPFVMPGVDFAYAFPYVSLGGTFSYAGDINASLAARGRLHLGPTVALTLGVRGALLPLDHGCGFFSIDGSASNCKQTEHFGQAFFLGGETGIEGRTKAGFMWRAQAGFWGMLAHGEGTCKAVAPAVGCSVVNPHPGAVFVQEITVGWAF